jgi:hypothetical protein
MPSSRKIGDIICRGLVPTWLLTGALAKLIDRTPALLPKPVRAVYAWIAGLVGMNSEADLTRFFDLALRTTIAIELSLVATMLLLPRVSRMAAAFILSVFVLVLASVVISGDASCGCFGSKGPPPVVVLVIDAALLAGVACFKPRPCALNSKCVGLWTAAVACSFALSFGMPAKKVEATNPAPVAPDPSTTKGAATPPPKSADAAPPTKSASAPPATPTQPSTADAAPGNAAWPSPPATLQPFYMPQVEQWVGKPLRAQPMAALIQQPIPADLERGRWIVMLYREDCEHCHAVLENHFVDALPAPTLLVAIPDTNPAAALPNPCSDCKVTSFIKGPEYVVGSPILLAIENGVVKRVCVDADDLKSLEATLQFK